MDASRLAQFINDAPNEVAMFDTNMRYIAVSERWLKRYRIETNIIDRCHYEVFPDLPESCKDAHNRGLNGERLYGRREVFHLLDGSPAWLNWEVRPWRNDDGQLGGLLIFSEDLTDVILAQQEAEERERRLIEQREIMERQAADLQLLASEAKKTDCARIAFMAAISHEIRTPLNAISGFANLLMRTDDLSQRVEFNETIVRAAQQLTFLVNDILDFVKLETKYFSLKTDSFDLPSLVSEMEAVLKSSVDDKRVEIEVWRDVEVPHVIKGDQDRIRQILLNLVSNACKFTQSGKIRFAVEGYRAEDAQWHGRFSVTDTGCGIEDEIRPHLFEPFLKGDVSGTMRTNGAGLGLTICQRLARSMGGEIGFDSTAGQGSRFWFEAPFDIIIASDADKKAPTDETHKRLARRPLRILIAEDTQASRQLLTVLLTERGHEVEQAEDGAAALMKASSTRYDLILMDYQMPEMDGIQATRCIRALNSPFSDVPVVLITADAVDEKDPSTRDVGMLAVLSKPISFDRLNGVLNKVAG